MGWIHKLAGDKRTDEQRQAASLNRRALIAMEKGDLVEAELRLGEAIKLASEMAEVHHNLGAVYLAQKKYSSAQRGNPTSRPPGPGGCGVPARPGQGVRRHGEGRRGHGGVPRQLRQLPRGLEGSAGPGKHTARGWPA